MDERVKLESTVLRWARERAGLSLEEVSDKIRGYADWESGQKRPTFNQLLTFANRVHVPVGMLYLSQPPVEADLIPDFRRKNRSDRFSVNLVDTIQLCLRRQDWYREYKVVNGIPGCAISNITSLAQSAEKAADLIKDKLKLSAADRRQAKNWSDFLSRCIERVRDSGVLIMRNSIVGNNTQRALSVDEFRAFTLSDNVAPLIFINSGDAKAAQIFSLFHEVAHVTIGKSGVSDDVLSSIGDGTKVEKWCDAVAAEVLVPKKDLGKYPGDRRDPLDLAGEISREYRVSILVALRRLRDANLISAQGFASAFDAQLSAYKRQELRSSGGGNFYNNLEARSDPNFATALVGAALEGQTLIGEALSLLSIKSTKVLRTEAERLGVI